MARRSAKAVLLQGELSSMDDGPIGHIELRRDAHANFTVWGRKYDKDPMTGGSRWFDWHKTKGIKSPMAVKKAIDDSAQYLNVEIEWDDVVPLIACVDWVTAAIIASNTQYDVPVLPTVEIRFCRSKVEMLVLTDAN